jgi:hypothetical protein
MARYYSEQLVRFKYDTDLFLDFIKTISDKSWLQREDRLTNLWSMDENRSFSKEHPFYISLFDALNLTAPPTDAYFSRVHAGGMPNHYDFESFSKLQFPCPTINTSIWNETKLMFIDNFDQVIEEITHVDDSGSLVPIIYNCQQMHATFRSLDCTNERITFVVDCNMWFSSLKGTYEDSTLLKANRFFHLI